MVVPRSGGWWGGGGGRPGVPWGCWAPPQSRHSASGLWGNTAWLEQNGRVDIIMQQITKETDRILKTKAGVPETWRGRCSNSWIRYRTKSQLSTARERGFCLPGLVFLCTCTWPQCVYSDPADAQGSHTGEDGDSKYWEHNWFGGQYDFLNGT